MTNLLMLDINADEHFINIFSRNAHISLFLIDLLEMNSNSGPEDCDDIGTRLSTHSKTMSREGFPDHPFM